jgi:hypothetical protein
MVDSEWLEAAPHSLKLGDRHPGADTTRIDQPPIRRIAAEQQRADPMSATSGIGPSHTDKLFAIEALDLKSSAAIGSI